VGQRCGAAPTEGGEGCLPASPRRQGGGGLGATPPSDELNAIVFGEHAGLNQLVVVLPRPPERLLSGRTSRIELAADQLQATAAAHLDTSIEQPVVPLRHPTKRPYALVAGL
jgi:hypothetical protein